MDTSEHARTVDEGASTRQPRFVYVRTTDGGDRVRIENQDDELVLDFIKDDRIANKLACFMNLGIIKGGSHGLLQD